MTNVQVVLLSVSLKRTAVAPVATTSSDSVNDWTCYSQLTFVGQSQISKADRRQLDLVDVSAYAFSGIYESCECAFDAFCNQICPSMSDLRTCTAIRLDELYDSPAFAPALAACFSTSRFRSLSYLGKLAIGVPSRPAGSKTVSLQCLD